MIGSYTGREKYRTTVSGVKAEYMYNMRGKCTQILTYFLPLLEYNCVISSPYHKGDNALVVIEDVQPAQVN